MYASGTPAPADWDRFVLRHPRGHLLQLAAWGQLKATFGWRVERIAITASATASEPPHILAGAQVLFRTRYGFSIAYVPRGPLFADNTAVNDLLLDELARMARRHRAVFLRLEPELLEDDAAADETHTWLLRKGFQPDDEPIQPRSTIHVDLTLPPDRLFASFSKGHRADIRRAERQGVTVRVGSADDIGAFFAVMQATGKRAEFGIHAEAYYYLAWKLFQKAAAVPADPSVQHQQPGSHLLIAEQKGQVVAGHMVFADARTGFYFYSGAIEQGMKAGANHLLQWHALQWAREQGCTGYDLWGIPDALGRAATSSDEQERTQLEEAAKSDPLIGVYRFKKGFGGRVVRYLPAYDQVYLGPLYRVWRQRFR